MKKSRDGSGVEMRDTKTLNLSRNIVSLFATLESFRFEDIDEDQDENEDQGQLLLTVRMLKSVTVMA